MTPEERRTRLRRALTPEESQFAADNIKIVWGYLRRRRLDPGDWFDVLCLRYLQAVKAWHTEARLREYSFTTIAVWAMHSAIDSEWKKQKRRPKTVSLYDCVPGAESLTFADVLAAPDGQRFTEEIC